MGKIPPRQHAQIPELLLCRDEERVLRPKTSEVPRDARQETNGEIHRRDGIQHEPDAGDHLQDEKAEREPRNSRVLLVAMLQKVEQEINAMTAQGLREAPGFRVCFRIEEFQSLYLRRKNMRAALLLQS